MKYFMYMLALCGMLAGCALTSMNNSEVRNPAPAPAPVESTEEHLGDPTFNTEVVEDTGPKATDNAVVDRGNTVPAAIEPAADEDLAMGLLLMDEGKLRDARMKLTGVLGTEPNAADEAEALKALRSINQRIFLSTGVEGDLKLYTVKAGDTLERVARAHGTTWEMIQRLNGLDGTRINVGQELKILGGKFELIVRKEKFVMDLMLDGAFIQRYEVGLGLQGSTPLGEFTVKNRIPKPADGSYPYGHEKHRLGSRWLGLSSEAGHKGYGIHGCRAEEESQIPGECSQGCVRMKNGDIEEVYDIIPAGTRLVVIAR